MLTFLRVKNLALIADIELEFSPGLTVLTGETGAGKSLLIQAIALLTGKRPSESLLRRGKSRAVVEGIFTLDDSLKKTLQESGYPLGDGTLHIRRVIQREGPNRAYINGETATLATLRALLNDRLQISGQHEHTTLREPEVQLWMLDAFAGLQKARADVGAGFRKHRELTERLRALEKKRENDRKDRELASFQLQEITSANLTSEEHTRLLEEKAIMNHAETLLRNLRETLNALFEGEWAALPQVQSALQSLQEMAEIDSRLEEPLKNLREAEIYIDDVVNALQHYTASIEFDPQRLEEVEDRLATYATLIKKYGGTLEAMFETATHLKDTLSRSEDMETEIHRLTEEKKAAWGHLVEAGRRLSEDRRKAARRFSKAMTNSLRELGMRAADFQVEVVPAAFPEKPTPSDATETGFDTVSFRFSANKGEPPLPIREVASGGELSRILLTVKALITGGLETQTIVFDEVDAGIGGRVADIVGKRIAEIARTTQVLCITHLPQIAAYGDHHLLITKRETTDHTRIGIQPLAERERVSELARMLGGETVTDTIKKHAEELFAAACSQKGRG